LLPDQMSVTTRDGSLLRGRACMRHGVQEKETLNWPTGGGSETQGPHRAVPLTLLLDAA
jgi:hypothetical protein